LPADQGAPSRLGTLSPDMPAVQSDDEEWDILSSVSPEVVDTDGARSSEDTESQSFSCSEEEVISDGEHSETSDATSDGTTSWEKMDVSGLTMSWSYVCQGKAAPQMSSLVETCDCPAASETKDPEAEELDSDEGQDLGEETKDSSKDQDAWCSSSYAMTDKTMCLSTTAWNEPNIACEPISSNVDEVLEHTGLMCLKSRFVETRPPKAWFMQPAFVSRHLSADADTHLPSSTSVGSCLLLSLAIAATEMSIGMTQLSKPSMCSIRSHAPTIPSMQFKSEKDFGLDSHIGARSFASGDVELLGGEPLMLPEWVSHRKRTCSQSFFHGFIVVCPALGTVQLPQHSKSCSPSDKQHLELYTDGRANSGWSKSKAFPGTSTFEVDMKRHDTWALAGAASLQIPELGTASHRASYKETLLTFRNAGARMITGLSWEPSTPDRPRLCADAFEPEAHKDITMSWPGINQVLQSMPVVSVNVMSSKDPWHRHVMARPDHRRYLVSSRKPNKLSSPVWVLHVEGTLVKLGGLSPESWALRHLRMQFGRRTSKVMSSIMSPMASSHQRKTQALLPMLAFPIRGFPQHPPLPCLSHAFGSRARMDRVQIESSSFELQTIANSLSSQMHAVRLCLNIPCTMKHTKPRETAWIQVSPNFITDVWLAVESLQSYKPSFITNKGQLSEMQLNCGYNVPANMIMLHGNAKADPAGTSPTLVQRKVLASIAAGYTETANTSSTQLARVRWAAAGYQRSGWEQQHVTKKLLLAAGSLRQLKATNGQLACVQWAAALQACFFTPEVVRGDRAALTLKSEAHMLVPCTWSWLGTQSYMTTGSQWSIHSYIQPLEAPNVTDEDTDCV